MKIRLSARVLSYLEGSGPYQGQTYSANETLEAAAQSMVAKIKEASQRKDGSRTVDLTETEQEVLLDYGTSLIESSRDELFNPDNRADYNAGRALVRQIDPNNSYLF